MIKLAILIYDFSFNFRSDLNGDCLYSSTCLALFGDNHFIDELRVMTSLELHSHAEFYCKHPTFSSMKSKGYVSTVDSALKLAVSDLSFNSNISGVELVKLEAFNNCKKFTWSSFLCILALSSVIQTSIQSLYPDNGLQKYRNIFNIMLDPRRVVHDEMNTINILFCHEGMLTSKIFSPNHFVLL